MLALTNNSKDNNKKLKTCVGDIHDLKAKADSLEHYKCSTEQFKEHLKQMDCTFENINALIEKNKDNTNRIESYLDKYINIRIQNIVATTLRGCLTGDARRNHELYDQDKMHLLFKCIIEDEGQPGDLEGTIHDMNVEARKRVEAMQEMQESINRKMSTAILRTARKMAVK